MQYSVALLKTAADCDLCLADAALQKSDLEFKRYQLEKKRNTTTNTSADIESAIPATEAEIAAYQATLVNLPEGDAKKSMQSKLTRAEYKLFTLTEKRESYGTIAMLQQEFDFNCIDNDVTEVDAYILALTNRKAEL